MKVIFLKDIKNVGRAGELKDVSDGYAKNFLIPNGLAKLATDSAVKSLAAKKEAEKKELEDLKSKLSAFAVSLKEKPLTLKVKVGEHNEIFGGIHANEIEKAIVEKGFSGFSVELARPLKAIGKHEILVKLGKGVEGKVLIEIKPL